MVEFSLSASIKSKESDTLEERWERKFGSVLAICWCAVFVSSKTKNVISFLNTHLMKLDSLKLLMKFLKICKSAKIKVHMTAKEVLSFWITLERQVLMTKALKVSKRVIQMMKNSELTRKTTAIRRNSSK